MKKISIRTNHCQTFRRLMMAFLLFCVNLTGIYAEKRPVTITLEAAGTTLKEVIEQIEEETDYRFIYSSGKIPLEARVSVDSKSQDLKQTLENVLLPLGIPYRIKENTIILKPSVQMQQPQKKGKGSVRGDVRDSNGNPLSYAAIVIRELNSMGTMADNDGKFYIPNISEGNYTLVISFLGYKTAEKKISVQENQTTTASITLTEEQSQLDEVAVYGTITRGQAKAMTQQKNSSNIKNVVSSDQIDRFPDHNAAEAVARIPSVSIDYDQGEGQNVQIRGIPPKYNSLTVNGQRIPAPDPDDNGSRGVGLDMLNQDLIESIEVTKAITPDMDGDAIGGSVNFKLKEAPDSTVVIVEAGGGINAQHSEFETYGKDIMNFSGFFGNRFLNKKLGILLGGSYYRTNRGSLLREFEYTDDDEIYDEVISAQHSNDYDVKRQRYGILLNADYQFNDRNKLYLNLNRNVYLDDEIRRSVDYVISDSEETRETRNRREEQHLTDMMFGGDHKIGQIELDYQAAWIKSDEHMPERTYWRYARDMDYSQYSNDEVKDFGPNSVLNSDDLLVLNRLRWDHNTKKDKDISGKLNLKIPFYLFASQNFFQAGGKYLRKTVSYRPDRTTLSKFGNPLTIEGGKFGQEDKRISDVDPDLYEAGKTDPNDDYAENSYKANETVTASYGMFTLNFTPKIGLVTGARWEHTQNKYRSLYESEENLDQNEEKSSYDNVLPSAHLTYKPTKKINVRLAYSTGIARPDYNSLVPVEIAGDESGNRQPITRGNPDLKPTKSNNYDLMLERYGNYLGFLSVGVFHKRLSDIISSYTFYEDGDNGITNEVTMPINRDHARVTGVEAALNQRLYFIHAPVLKDLTFYANYTYTHTKYEVDGRELPLSSSPKNIFNLALMYDNAKNGWSFVISNVYRDAILTSEGDNKYLDQYYDSEYHLDVSVGKRIGDHFSLLLQLNNLTDQKEREVLGDPGESYARTLQWENYNWSGTLKLRYKL